MGRRGRSKRNWDDDDDDDDPDGLERAEMEWLASKKRRGADEEEVTATAHSETPSENGTPSSAPQETTHNVAENDVKESAKTAQSDAVEREQIERMQKKKQQKKQRQKEKRKNKAAAEARKQRHKESAAPPEKKKRVVESKEGFTTLAKGVKYQDVSLGTGPAVRDRKKVHVRYVLRAKSHVKGKILDSSENFGFRLGRGEVIQGWDIGLEGMKVGGVRRLVVPPLAGYGSGKDVGAGKGADLYFQIDLLHVAP